MKNVKPGKKMCVPQERSDNRRETDTLHNKPFDAILNNVRSIETFRRVSVKCGAFILDEENNGILRRLLYRSSRPIHIYSLTYITEFLWLLLHHQPHFSCLGKSRKVKGNSIPAIIWEFEKERMNGGEMEGGEPNRDSYTIHTSSFITFL
jgi:hypothetical protein